MNMPLASQDADTGSVHLGQQFIAPIDLRRHRGLVKVRILYRPDTDFSTAFPYRVYVRQRLTIQQRIR